MLEKVWPGAGLGIFKVSGADGGMAIRPAVRHSHGFFNALS